MKRFLEIQEKSLSDANRLSLNLGDVPGLKESTDKAQEAAIAHVRGHPFDRAIARLVFIADPTDVAALKKQMADIAKQAPLQAILGAVAVGKKGETTGKISPALKGGQPDETGAQQRMYNHAKMFTWRMQVIWLIEPARQAILNEHPVRLRDLFALIENNPFIPPGHEGIYLRGFQSGFFGDWLTAMSLLLPQVEASLRYLLDQRGIPTTSLDAEGIQQEKDINRLLFMPEIESLLDPDILFDLRGIMIDKFGHNMRNEACQALMSEPEFYQPVSVYLWWLLIRLCYVGYRWRVPEALSALTNGNL